MSRPIFWIVSVLRTCALVLIAVSVSTAQAIPFQGLLTDNVGTPLNGTYDLQFTLYDAVTNGSPVGSSIDVGDISITGGIVNTELDFGDAFWDQDLWLLVGVRDGASAGSYEPISPRTPILWSPRATTAARLGAMINEVPGSGINVKGTYDMRFYLDDDDNQPNEWFSVYDGDDNVLLRLTEVATNSPNAVVQVPAASISPTETSGEAGLVNTFGSGAALSGVATTLASGTITLPTNGYVIAIATWRLDIDASSGATFWISENTTAWDGEEDTNASGSARDQPSSYIRVFSTTAGAKTYNFVGQELGGTVEVADPRLLLLFVPTSYGTVETSSPGPIDPEFGAGLTQADIEASRVASIEANQRRIERELAEMKAEMEAMRSESAK